MVTSSCGTVVEAFWSGEGAQGSGCPVERRTSGRLGLFLRHSWRWPTALLVAGAVVALAGCSSQAPSVQPDGTGSGGTGGTSTATSGGASPVGTDQEITFAAGQVTVHGSLRMPPNATGPVPAAVLLAGSGPTDRNGNTPSVPGTIGTLSSLADVLAAHGVASLRYDKLSSGATGLGPYASDPASIGYTDFLDEARGGLGFLAGRTDIDTGHLLLLGHSEGALIALSVAAQPAPGQPAVAAVGLLESPGSRYLDLISSQIVQAMPTLVAAGRMNAGEAETVTQALPTAVSTLRTTGSFPAGLPTLLQQSGLSTVNAHFLYQADQADPVQLAAALPAGLPVLTTCSQADQQVPCSEMAKLDAALSAATLTPVTMTTADHALKDEPPGMVASSISDLAFSAELPPALASWLASVTA